MNIYEVVELSDRKSRCAVGWLCTWGSRECGQKWSDADRWIWLIPGITRSCFLCVPLRKEKYITSASEIS